jgi:hypothetical protein
MLAVVFTFDCGFLGVARTGDFIPIGIKRAVWSHSHGRCQYRDCPQQLVSVDPVTGHLGDSGEFAHILPVGEGPRAEFKALFPHVDLNSAANLILLCPNHHELVDQIAVDKHPPEILFRMKVDKSILLNDSITNLLELQTFLQIGIDDYRNEYEVSAIIDLFMQARSLGPQEGASLFKKAEELFRSISKNPYLKKGEPPELLLNIEYHFTKLYMTYKNKSWQDALLFTMRVLKRPLPDGLLFHLLSCAMTLVRDEYLAFNSQEKVALIAQIIGVIDHKLGPSTSSGAVAFLLLVKSALLRWRGRSERGPNQRNTFGEAQRCSDKSYNLSSNPGCLLQSALIKYSTALSFQLSDAPKHQPFIDECLQLLVSPLLANFPAAIKYRPRIYRETYQFSESIDSFWIGAEQYPSEFRRVAYIVGEAATGEHFHRSQSDMKRIQEACKFLQSAIERGYNHGRNVIAYIGCRGILEPEWFKRRILNTIISETGASVAWREVLKSTRNVLYDPKDKHDEPSFGIDEGEFWNTLGGITGRVLGDHTNAIHLLKIAENHAQVSGGRFRAFVGLARQYQLIGDVPNFEHYLDAARTIARAHQLVVIADLEGYVST